MAIAEASPEIADKITELGSDPALFKRLLDAAELIIAGNVYQNHVASQTDPDRFYKVDYRMGYHCQCDSFFYRPITLEGYGDMCKHSLAQHLAVILDIDLEAAPIPFQGETLAFDETDVF